LSDKDKLDALTKIHQFHQFTETRRDATQKDFEQQAGIPVEEFASVFWSEGSYGIWGEDRYTRERFLERADEKGYEIVQWLSTPTRVIDFNTLA
jgi:hypothetical protein